MPLLPSIFGPGLSETDQIMSRGERLSESGHPFDDLLLFQPTEARSARRQVSYRQEAILRNGTGADDAFLVGNEAGAPMVIRHKIQKAG